MNTTVQVFLPGQGPRSYDIAIAAGSLATIPSLCAAMGKHRRVFVISDSTVASLYGHSLLRTLIEIGMDAVMLDFPAGERSKTNSVALAIQSRLLELKVRRDSLVVALGGGVTGDLAGYVAATILRGIDFIQVPTSLLAQVDSSVGGKVGIDHPLGKNLIGAFHQPKAVVIDPLALRTLSKAEYRNGLAEIVKIAAALDRGMFRSLERNVAGLNARSPETLRRVILWSVRLKAAVVQKDEREAGLRKVLNLGHTIGHAVEAAMGYRVRHGEAVAIGLAAEARIASQMGLLPKNDAERVVRLLRALQLPTELPRRLDRRRFQSAMSVDKKAEGADPRFVLLGAIGESIIGAKVPHALILDMLA